MERLLRGAPRGRALVDSGSEALTRPPDDVKVVIGSTL